MKIGLNYSLPPPPPPPPTPEKKKKPILLIVAVIIIVIIIGIAAAFFFLKGSIPSFIPIGGGETTTGGGTGQQPPSGGEQPPTETTWSWQPGQWVRYETNQGFTIEIRVEGYETKEGVNCIKMTQTMEVEQGEITTTIWIDPTTGKTVWWHQVIKIGTQTIEKEGPGTQLPVKGKIWVITSFGKYLGEETITVPAGTFTCKKYSKRILGGETILWVNDQIPVTKLVKSVTKEGGKTIFEMELVAYGG